MYPCTDVYLRHEIGCSAFLHSKEKFSAFNKGLSLFIQPNIQNFNTKNQMMYTTLYFYITLLRFQNNKTYSTKYLTENCII